jgi:hypothetical protein
MSRHCYEQRARLVSSRLEVTQQAVLASLAESHDPLFVALAMKDPNATGI